MERAAAKKKLRTRFLSFLQFEFDNEAKCREGAQHEHVENLERRRHEDAEKELEARGIEKIDKGSRRPELTGVESSVVFEAVKGTMKKKWRRNHIKNTKHAENHEGRACRRKAGNSTYPDKAAFGRTPSDDGHVFYKHSTKRREEKLANRWYAIQSKAQWQPGFPP